MWLYQLLLKALKPIILKKVRKYEANYTNYRITEAFGEWPETKADFWLHCSSVGEVLASKELVKGWLATHLNQTILITTVTPTGAEQVDKLFRDNSNVLHRYLPLDFPSYVDKALSSLDCKKMAIVETELWPNLLRTVKSQGIAVCIINARMSEKSARNYLRFPRFSKKLFSLPDVFLAHHKSDAERFTRLGAKNVKVSGSIKFDITPTKEVLECDWRDKLGKDRLVWIGASTHEGEDEILLKAHQALQKTFTNALLILVPRHPERFQKVTKLAEQYFSNVEKRSDDQAKSWASADILIGDSMGELMHYYQASDIAFVGGSLIERGGHNPIEPAVLGKPILVGPHTFNFKEITESLIEEGGCVRSSDKEVLVQALNAFASGTLRDEAGQKALDFAKKNQGALERTLNEVEGLTLTGRTRP